MWGVRSPVVSGPPITFPTSSQGKFLNVVRRPIMAFSWLMVKRFWRSQFWRMWGGAIAQNRNFIYLSYIFIKSCSFGN
jgi:hypothetical protein